MPPLLRQKCAARGCAALPAMSRLSTPAAALWRRGATAVQRAVFERQHVNTVRSHALLLPGRADARSFEEYRRKRMQRGRRVPTVRKQQIRSQRARRGKRLRSWQCAPCFATPNCFFFAAERAAAENDSVTNVVCGTVVQRGRERKTQREARRRAFADSATRRNAARYGARRRSDGKAARRCVNARRQRQRWLMPPPADYSSFFAVHARCCRRFRRCRRRR